MDIHKLIAGLSPETYCLPEMAKQVRRLLRQKDTDSRPEAVLQAALSAEPRPANLLPIDKLEALDPFDRPGLQAPHAQYHFSRDAFAESVEAFYFSILNHLEQLDGWQVFKLVDEFQSSLLSSPFADVAKQQSLIQHQVFEGLEAIHELTRDMLETVQRLETEERNRVQGSTNDPPKDAIHSRADLDLHRARLHSQLALLKLRAAAVRPWLRRGASATALDAPSAGLVSALNTAEFQVTLLAVGPDVLPEAIQSQVLPRWMNRKVRRSYRPVLLLELTFRARPHRSRSQGYAYRGKAEITLTSYGLHDAELAALRQAIEAQLLRDSLHLGRGETTEALDALVHRIEQRVNPQPVPPVDQATEEANPFSALFSLLKNVLGWLWGWTSRYAASRESDLRPDSAHESVVRSLAVMQAHQQAQDLYQTLKSHHSISASAP